MGGGGEGQIGGAVRGGGALAALPSAQPQALLLSAPAPASTRGGVSGQISARIKERPASARSRVAMGAPPLASARSARASSRRDTGPPAAPPAPPNRHTPSRGGTDTLGDEMTPESPKNDTGRDGRLFKYPEWDEVPPPSFPPSEHPTIRASHMPPSHHPTPPNPACYVKPTLPNPICHLASHARSRALSLSLSHTWLYFYFSVWG